MGSDLSMNPPTMTLEQQRDALDAQIKARRELEEFREQPGVFNLTQHKATPEQIEAGVVEPASDLKPTIQRKLTFGDIPSDKQLANEAAGLTDIAKRSGYYRIMIGGYPALMIHLYLALKAAGLQPVFAHSKRVSVETTDPETGEVTKVSRFKHEGFVTV